MRSWTSATNLFGSVMTNAQECSLLCYQPFTEGRTGGYFDNLRRLARTFLR